LEKYKNDMSVRRKIYKHLIETNYLNISSTIKQFKKRRATKANNNK